MPAIYQIILAGLISFLGVVFGGLIANFTKEELKSGEKYFRVLCILLMSIIITFVLYSTLILNTKNLIYFALVLLFGAIIGLYLRIKYFYFGLAFALTAISKQNFLLLASLVFLFGLPYGSLLFLGKKFKKEAVISAILFFSAFFLVYIGSFLSQIFQNNIAYFLAFSAGNLLGILAKAKIS